MKAIKYKLKSGASMLDVIMDYSEANEEIAKQEAYNGEYVIEDVAEEV